MAKTAEAIPRKPARRATTAFLRGAVLGQDVSKSRSPDIHQAAWKALGREGAYGAISLPGRSFRHTVRRMANEGYRYVNVTIPHKRLAAAMATSCAPAVAMTGAANTLVFKRDRRGALKIHADNTDGEGLLLAMADLGLRVQPGTKIVMVGAGGAAAGALLALVRAGATVVLLARRLAPARALARRLPARLQSRVRAGALAGDALADALADAHVLVSAVPAAAWQDPALLAGLRALSRDGAVVEMAYGGPTPLGRAARRRTRRYQDGLAMLVHQAARAVEVALGTRPPAAPLFRAVGRKTR